MRTCVWVTTAIAGLSSISSLAAATTSAAIPDRVRAAIGGTHPLFPYVPTRLPAGYRYSKWAAGGRGFSIWFSKTGQAPNNLGYDASPSAFCTPHPMRTFTMNGVSVSWSATSADQEAWRCFRRAHRVIVVTASRSVQGDDALNTPKRRRDALDLVRLVAYIQRI